MNVDDLYAELREMDAKVNRLQNALDTLARDIKAKLDSIQRDVRRLK